MDTGRSDWVGRPRSPGAVCPLVVKMVALVTSAKPLHHVSCCARTPRLCGHLWGDIVLAASGLEQNPRGSMRSFIHRVDTYCAPTVCCVPPRLCVLQSPARGRRGGEEGVLCRWALQDGAQLPPAGGGQGPGTEVRMGSPCGLAESWELLDLLCCLGEFA